MPTDRVRQIANFIALIGVLAVNFLAEAIPLNGLTSAQIANRYPDLLYFPANYAFSIWSVIYTFLIAFGIYQALPAQRENSALRRIGWLFVASCIFNAAWLISFHYLQFAFSMIMMVALLITLVTIYLRLGIGVEAVSRATKWLIHVPFSLYLGWITAATITNAAYVLTDAGWSGFGIDAQTWALLMLAITGLLAGYIVYTRRDIAYGLVIVWAVTSIAVRHADIAAVNLASVIVSAIVALLVAYAIWRYFDSKRLGWSM
jgi:benzodiazapine receptor